MEYYSEADTADCVATLRSTERTPSLGRATAPFSGKNVSFLLHWRYSCLVGVNKDNNTSESILKKLLVTSAGKSKRQIKQRTDKAKTAFQNMEIGQF